MFVYITLDNSSAEVIKWDLVIITANVMKCGHIFMADPEWIFFTSLVTSHYVILYI